MRTTLPLRLMSLGLVACLSLTAVSCAQEDKKADRYAVPETNKPEELLKFIEGLQTYRPATPTESLDHRKQAPKAMMLAADKILEVAKDQSSDAYRLALAIIIQKKVSGLYLKTAEEQAQQYAEWKKLFAKASWGRPDLSTANAIANSFEEIDNLPLAIQAYTDFAKMLESQSGKNAKQVKAMFEGSARRLKLPGTVLDLTGTQLDGKKFDLKSLKGKVVLVDFFATWCGPCLAEVPNLRKAYDEYHDRGFEIVSISIDEDRDALEGFEKNAKLPWLVLHEKEEGGNHPAMDYYGINGIPAMFLVDKEGKVVSLNARGTELHKLLKELLPKEEKK